MSKRRAEALWRPVFRSFASAGSTASLELAAISPASRSGRSAAGACAKSRRTTNPSPPGRSGGAGILRRTSWRPPARPGPASAAAFQSISVSLPVTLDSRFHEISSDGLAPLVWSSTSCLSPPRAAGPGRTAARPSRSRSTRARRAGRRDPGEGLAEKAPRLARVRPRAQLRSRRPGLWPAKGSQRTTSPLRRSRVSCARRSGRPRWPRRIVKVTGASAEAGSRRVMLCHPGTCRSARPRAGRGPRGSPPPRAHDRRAPAVRGTFRRLAGGLSPARRKSRLLAQG